MFNRVCVYVHVAFNQFKWSQAENAMKRIKPYGRIIEIDWMMKNDNG